MTNKPTMHIDFDPLKVEWSGFASTSPEVVVQYGGYNIFRGVPYQRGAGLGSVLRSFLRYLVPIGKEIGGAIGRQGLESGNRVLSNVLEGKNLKESLVTEGKSGLKNLLEKAANNLNSQKGQGFDFKRYKSSIPSKGIGKSINRFQSSVGPPNFLPTTVAKRRKSTKKPKTKNKIKRLRVDRLGAY